MNAAMDRARRVIDPAANAWRAALRAALARCVRACAIVLLGQGAAHADAVQRPAVPAMAERQILILSPYGYGRPGIDSWTRSFLDVVVAGGVNSEHVTVEFLNLNRNTDPEAKARIRQSLEIQYRAKPPDLIVAIQQPALDFMLGELAQFAPAAPVLAMSATLAATRPAPSHALLVQSSSVDNQGTLRQALALFPATTNVLVAVGASANDQIVKRELEKSAAAWRGRLTFEYTDTLNVEAIMAKAAHLPRNTIILSAGINRDVDGHIVTPYDMTQRLSTLANAPIFVLYSTVMGRGPLGGSVLHLERQAAQLADTALALLAGSAHLPADASTLTLRPTPMYDSVQLKRWGADPARLPPDTIFVNREATMWEQHRALVLATLAVFLALLGMLAGLLLQRRSLARAQLTIRESEARYRVLVENAPEAIVVYDVEQRLFVDANSKAEQLFGCSRAQLLCRGPHDFYDLRQPDGTDSADSIARNAQSTLDGNELVFERAMHDLAGRYFPCEVSTVRLPAAGRHLLRGSYVDISERKRVEHELLLYRDHLEELVQQRTAALSVAVQQANAASRAKSVFLSNMSHELRTPLNSVIGFSELMAASTSMQEEEKRNLAIINRSGRHLLTLIDDVLELSKLEAGRVPLQLERLDLNRLLHELLDAIRPRTAHKALALVYDCSDVPALVQADGAKLRQVLQQLLSNAVKFTEQGSVTLALTCRPGQPGRITLAFAVRDTGIGIAPADLEHIFLPFTQAVAPNMQSGTGLGLSIGREFVRLMGGELGVHSQLGAGSQFAFSIEVLHDTTLAGAPQQLGQVAELAQHERGKTVLALDDDPLRRAGRCALLKQLGFIVLEAADGASAAGLMKHAHIALILIERQVGGQDGIALMGALRAVAPAPVLMFGAPGGEHEGAAIVAAGAAALLCEPLDRQALFDTLESVLQMRFVRREVLSVSAPPDAGALCAEQLGALPEPARKALMLAVRDLDLGNAGALLATLAPQHATLVARIQAMLDAYRYMELWQLLGDAAADDDLAGEAT